MQVEIKIDHSCVEPRVLIRTAAMTDEIQSIVNWLSGQPTRILSGSREKKIINLNKVRNFDLNFTGTICVEFINHSKTYVSRRYVAKIKKILGI